jgi:preprotein translocase subunit SecG
MPESKPKKAGVKPSRSNLADAENAVSLEPVDLTNEFKTAHYSASVTAWFGTKMEKDKSLLTLASAGTGILVSIGAASRIERICYVLAISFFVITVFLTLVVFELNAKLIENLILEQKMERLGKIAALVDYTLILSFFFGVVAFAMLGIARFMNW